MDTVRQGREEIGFRRRHTLSGLIPSIPAGCACEVRVRDHDMVAELVPIGRLAADLAADPTRVSLAWDSRRPGTLRYVTRLEHEHYPPSDQARNVLLRIYHLEWSGLYWHLATVPTDGLPILYGLAALTDMRIADGAPVRFGGFPSRVDAIGAPNRRQPLRPGDVRFPIGPERVWTLENSADSPARRDAEAHLELELEEVDAYLAARGIPAREPH